MEVSSISQRSVKIKGKQVIFLVNPEEGKNKISADASLLLGTTRSQYFFHEDGEVIFQGAGEYEVKAAKTTGFKVENETMFTISLDGMSVFVGNSSSCMKAKDKLHEHDIAIIDADDVLSQTSLGFLSAKVIIFFGDKLEENAKAYGKELQKTTKYTITKEKLPQEVEFIFLG